MNDKIKEIKTIGQLLDYVETEAKAKELIYYITNLQEENEDLRKNQRYYKNGVFSLEYDKETLSDMVDDYKSRINKAIDYIQGYNLANSIVLKRSYADLLDILRGESNE